MKREEIRIYVAGTNKEETVCQQDQITPISYKGNRGFSSSGFYKVPFEVDISHIDEAFYITA